MCGIFAFVKSEKTDITIERREAIAKLLHHRGPDHWDYWQNDRVFLLQTRLKILDLDDRSNQPFLSADGRYLILYNGECYNYRSIKSELESLGHVFRTTSDTEVLLTSFKEWGEEFIHKVAGMFSIVIFDRESGLLYAWRDRLGIKPLYFSRINEGIILSSEIKPFLEFRRAELNEASLWSYFNLRYVAGDSTMFAGISEVPPGGFMVFQDGKLLKNTLFWDITKIEPEKEYISPEDLYKSFKQIVSEHNQADVDIGCFLSGGVDSASVAALSVEGGAHLKAFTLSTGLENDEKERARLIASHLQIPQEVIGVQDTSFELYRKALWHLEDPIGDSIIVPTLLLAQGASRSHKVILSGEGADEIFGGYIHQQFLSLEDKILNKIPKVLQGLLHQMAGIIPLSVAEKLFPYPSSLGEAGWSKTKNHLMNLGSPLERYFSLVGLFTGSSENIFSQSLTPPGELQHFWNSMGDHLSFADKLKRFDLKYWARNYTLHRLDRLSMASSLEGRVPFFDHRLVELVLKIPSDKIYHLKDPKKYFRKSLKHSTLPAEVIRRRKQAFFLPAEKVFSKDLLKKAKEEILDNSTRRGFFNRKALEQMLMKEKPELLDAKQFQVLYHFELWGQLFLD